MRLERQPMGTNRSDFTLVTITATGTDNYQPTILEFSRFLYEVHLSYEIARLGTDPKYSEFKFPERNFTPVTSRLHWQDRLELEGVRRESPWRFKASLIAVAAAAPTLWALTQTFEKIANYQLDREKVRAEIHEIQIRTRSEQLSNIEKATELGVPLTQEEVQIGLPQTRQDVHSLEEAEIVRLTLARRDALQFYERSQRTLQMLPFRVDELNFEIVSPRKSQHGKK